ncbi:MAG: site-2 protease family protein [Vicinamibacteraceae bacterium]
MNPAAIFIALVVLAFSLSFHEMAHAWTAYRLGDPTAYNEGRVSMNPAVHVDPIGTILFPLISMLATAAGASLPLIGWAKPVPFLVRNLSRPRRDVILIALAGPASNLILAGLISIVIRVALPMGWVPTDGIGSPTGPFWEFLRTGFLTNLALAVFNLIPVPPLDGGKVLSNLLPLRSGLAFDELAGKYGFIVLYALMLTGVLSYLMRPSINFLAVLLLSW